METLESRELYADDAVRVFGRMVPDYDDSPRDYDCYDADDIANWETDEWSFVGMLVSVSLRGVEIAGAGLWSVEHGHICEGVVADAWVLEPAEYPAPDTVVMSSALSGVACDALDAAREWLTSIGAPTDVLAAAVAHFDPNRKPKPVVHVSGDTQYHRVGEGVYLIRDAQDPKAE